MRTCFLFERISSRSGARVDPFWLLYDTHVNPRCVRVTMTEPKVLLIPCQSNLQRLVLSGCHIAACAFSLRSFRASPSKLLVHVVVQLSDAGIQEEVPPLTRRLVRLSIGTCAPIRPRSRENLSMNIPDSVHFLLYLHEPS